MAADIVFSEVLCFIRNNFDKLTASEIKPVLCSFYGEEDLFAAKDSLLKAVQQAVQCMGDSTPLPRLPKRQGDVKGKQTVDDILKLFAIIDERKLTDSIPRFVAEDLTKIPFVIADSISVLAMAKKLETLENRLSSVEKFLSSTCSENTPECSTYSHVLHASTLCSKDTSSTSLADQTVTGIYTDDDFPPLPVSTVANDHNHWQLVVNKRKHHTKAKADTNKVQPQYENRKSVGTGNRKVFGVRQPNSDSAVRAGVSIVQKSVVHIDNLHADCTDALLKDYLTSLEIQVLTCYPSKSWLRAEEERDQVTAFRVCVPVSERYKIFDPQIWSEGVLIRDWKFKKNSHGATSGS